MASTLRSLRVKDFRQQGEVFRVRAIVAFVVILLCLGGLVARFAILQITHHDEFTAKSESNRISTRGIAPSRGLIYDRNGVLIADNTAAFRLEVVPEGVKLNAMLAELAEVIALSDDDITRFNAARRNKKPFESVPLRLKLSEDEIAHFSINRWRFPAVDVVPYLTRTYPFGETFAHVVGYVGRIDVGEAARLDENLYTGTTHIGKTGIERYYEDVLHGTPGYEKVEVNAEKRVVRPIEREAPTPGKNLYLSVDARLQRIAEEAFNGRAGAAVALDPRTGEVLAMVSVPSFDANMFVNGISQIDYGRLMGDPNKPLLAHVFKVTTDPFVGYVWHTTPIKTLADMRTTEVVMGGVAVGTASTDYGSRATPSCRPASSTFRDRNAATATISLQARSTCRPRSPSRSTRIFIRSRSTWASTASAIFSVASVSARALAST